MQEYNYFVYLCSVNNKQTEKYEKSISNSSVTHGSTVCASSDDESGKIYQFIENKWYA